MTGLWIGIMAIAVISARRPRRSDFFFLRFPVLMDDLASNGALGLCTTSNMIILIIFRRISIVLEVIGALFGGMEFVRGVQSGGG